MDKSSYDTYYPPANESESESDQFFIVQDNGTFIINRQVQYVTPIHNVKGPLEQSQPCGVYDVAPQQFLVDVDNASELISVSDQYGTDAQSNLFSNSFLLQPGTASAPEPVEQNIAENLDQVPEISKESGDCTEITLSDEQYQMLEQKGWLLLEIGDKMYVLNTLGLHDITANDKLIKKLKNESQSDQEGQDINIGTCNLENDTEIIFQTDMNDFPQSLSGQDEKSGKVKMETDITEDDNSVNDSTILSDSKADAELNKEKPIISETALVNKDCPEVPEQDTEMNTSVLVIENESIQKEGNTLKIKTKLSLKDFPDKIVLGKTLNGKRLVAKVIKQNTGADDKTPDCNKDKPEDDAMSISLSAPYNNTEESEFYILLQHLFRNNLNKTKCTAADVVTADSVIAQLLQIPAFKPTVVASDLIITKVSQKIGSSGKILSRVLSAAVTGKVSQISEQWRFVHLPHMLQKMVHDTEELLAKYKKSGSSYSCIIKDDYSVLHVQILESKEEATDVRISVTVNKRNIPIHLITNRNQHQPNKMYACIACAAVFGTELELRDHQADHALEAEDILTIDTDQQTKISDICVIETIKGKSYTCMQCNATFNRITSCRKHLKTHCNSLNQDKTEPPKEEKKSKAIYKCNMCTCTYFHPSTLSKHILSRHINKVALLPDNYFQQ